MHRSGPVSGSDLVARFFPLAARRPPPPPARPPPSRSAPFFERDDVIRAIKTVSVLGKGFGLLTVGSRQMVQSVPMELSNDLLTVLSLAQVRARSLPRSRVRARA